MAKKALIVNEGYSSNLGDQAIKTSLEELMHKLGFETEFCYFTNPALHQLPAYEYVAVTSSFVSKAFNNFKKILQPFFSVFIYSRYYLFLRKSLKARLDNRHFDMVLIGGGQLINSTIKQKLSFFAIALFVWSRILNKKYKIPFHLIGVGVAGKFHAFEKFIYKKALQYANSVWVRDRFSQKSLKLNFEVESQLMPDVAFYQTINKPVTAKKKLALVGIFSYDEYIKIHKIIFGNRKDYNEFWKQVVVDYLNKGLQVSLFYTTQTDAKETYLFQQYLKREGLVIPVLETNSLAALNSIYETTACVYSARMHALILALKKGCNVQAFPISDKLKSFESEYIESGTEPVNYSDELLKIFEKVFLAGDKM